MFGQAHEGRLGVRGERVSLAGSPERVLAIGGCGGVFRDWTTGIR